ncbi:50S ribosomal protein L13 [candidate division WWE3 bacterium]|uniref:Large ribosomal subunit protein uL13 n=1 Tax=candidate division WWE3 bacterium TaxID=2053526 RepID=A0A955LL02_UNCKA|nr:50S ribosomal protein L13 [candidate division WWE3 bacterium]
MLTTSIKPKDITRKWYIVDAKDKVLGRVASKIAPVLEGKNHTYYSPQWDMGDHVIVINAQRVALTGNKETDKKYYRHTGYPGGIKSERVADVRKKDAARLIEMAVRGMLPRNRLAKEMIKKMHIYVGGDHPHEAQQPEVLEV